jgi:DNA (cytosine-5)-methyltransferase 1
MIHLGDITKINGAEIEPVDCITAGSPCQDLSVAGLRKGLKGDRSGLFMEQIRIIKEMREHDRELGRAGEYVRPRYMVWENVPGALSSNKGEDFRCVLEETARLIQEDAVIPRPAVGGWQHSGVILLDNGSIAWSIHDAQYWGVPQRRKRICVLADLNGHNAPGILFGTEYRRVSEGREQNETVGDIGTESGIQVQPIEESLQRDTETCR